MREKLDQNNKIDNKEVKCLCEHGKCRKGENFCEKCDLGWTGKYCDMKTVTNMKFDSKPSTI